MSSGKTLLIDSFQDDVAVFLAVVIATFILLLVLIISLILAIFQIRDNTGKTNSLLEKLIESLPDKPEPAFPYDQSESTRSENTNL